MTKRLLWATAGVLTLLVAPAASQGIQVAAVADRDKVQIGEEVTLSLRATSADASAGPLRVVLPPAFDGFDVVSRNELSELGADGSRRLLILEVRLRAARVGEWRLWPIRVEQGFQVVVAPVVMIEVAGGSEETAAALTRSNPRIARLLERATPPRRGDVAVTTAVSLETAYAGEQVDLATAAWFPRTLLGRLRRPPTLKPPSVSGVWTLPQAVSPGVAASRLVDGEWYDLFVSHQVFFPLTTGTVRIPPAVLTFAVPVGPQYFSEERTYELSSNSTSLEVRAAPVAPGMPVATRLSLRYEGPKAGPTRAGDLMPVALELRGEGNVALWPTPIVTWPGGVRAYPERTEEEASLTDGRAGGVKRFRFLVLADSAGPVVLPEVRYPYFDPVRGRELETTARSIIIPVQPSDPNITERPSLPLGLPVAEPPLSRAWRGMPPAARFTSIGVPLLLALVLALPGLRKRRRPRVVPGRNDPVADFTRWIFSVVPAVEDRQSGRLAPALRRHGVAREEAEAIARAWEGIQRAAYGPATEGEETAAASLVGETERLLGRVARTAVLLVLLSVGSIHGQAPSPADLYAGGQFRAATSAYLRRAGQDPNDPWRWYAAAVSAYAAGDNAVSAAAFLRARRLAPRNSALLQGWRALVAAEPEVERANGSTAPVAPAELFALALALWLVGGFMVVTMRRRWRTVGIGVVATSILFGFTGWTMQRTYRQPLAVVARTVSLRAAPHGLAADVGGLDRYRLVPVARSEGAWRLVRGGDGRRGWVPADALVELNRLN